MSTYYAEIKIIEGLSPLLRRVKCVAKQQFVQLDPRSLKKPELVLIDYDNTLVDSWPQDFATSNKVLKELRRPPMSVLETLKRPHIPALQAIVERTNIDYETVKKVYNRIYEEVHAELAPPLPGAEKLLLFLKENKIPTIVISNKEDNLLQTTIEEIGWNKYFSGLYGAKINEPKKPDPEIVHRIVKKMNKDIMYDSVYLVGDALSNDIQCALAAGVIPVWLSDYSVDELIFGQQGPGVLKANNFLELIRIFEKCLRNS